MNSDNIKIESVSPRYYLTEGPVWSDRDQALYFVAMFEQAICRYHPATDSHSKLSIDKAEAKEDLLTFVLPHATHREKFIISLGRRIGVVTWNDITKNQEGAKFSLIILTDQNKPQNRLNDAKCDSRGNIWAGTMGPTDLPHDPVPRQGSLYCINSAGKIKTLLSEVSLSNGLEWNEESKIFYFIDSAAYKVYSYDHFEDGNRLENKKVVSDFMKLGTSEFPDGMTIDKEGFIWIAGFGNSSIHRIDPSNGSVLKTIKIPVASVTSLCFGGPNMDEIYVTTTAKVVNGEDSSNPLAGTIFRIKGLGIQGVSSHGARIEIA